MDRELKRLKREKDAIMERAMDTLDSTTQKIEDHLTQVQDEYARVAQFSGQAGYVIDQIDRQFREKTKLSGSDTVFLFLCVALQCARQYLLTNDKLRITAAQGDTLVGDTIGQITPPTWEDALFQSVPYDAIKTSTHISETGLAGTTHRYRTLGHDPVLGWIFGTANIMTNSLTKSDIVTTYQVSNGYIIRHYPLGTMGMMNKAVEYAQNDPMLLAASTARQAIHFGSDYFTKQSLPIPFLGTLSPEMAHRFMFPFKDDNKRAYIDMWSITRGAALSALINQLIATIHRLFYNEDRDGTPSMYEVRTRKILSYSNAMATGSNILVTAFTKDLTKLDVGGALVTLYRIVSDYKFIHEIKRDFLKNEFYNIVVGEDYDFMKEEHHV
ncbi:hypothetical protein [Pseudoflavonifractor sp. An184]|uniref:hypothetical protein n=1 Tax=Pseudoflavonifractor sp. An184 TaxID=1965576 RepID=UPI000B36C694|nr:hypothetical protein [Pseudoflavonifractor sp. An184]OUP49075.1 hypothetical protein B5F19_15995 [Pseudoflavonifractor sp. An184]